MSEGFKPEPKPMLIVFTIKSLQTFFSEIISKYSSFSFKKMHLLCCLQNVGHFFQPRYVKHKKQTHRMDSMWIYGFINHTKTEFIFCSNCFYQQNLPPINLTKTHRQQRTSVDLTRKQLETHGHILSTVATDALVLKHQAISIHSAD